MESTLQALIVLFKRSHVISLSIVAPSHTHPSNPSSVRNTFSVEVEVEITIKL